MMNLLLNGLHDLAEHCVYSYLLIILAMIQYVTAFCLTAAMTGRPWPSESSMLPSSTRTYRAIGDRRLYGIEAYKGKTELKKELEPRDLEGLPILSYFFLLHVYFYFSVVNVEILYTLPEFMGFVLSLVPLAVPFRIYYDRLVLSLVLFVVLGGDLRRRPPLVAQGCSGGPGRGLADVFENLWETFVQEGHRAC